MKNSHCFLPLSLGVSVNTRGGDPSDFPVLPKFLTASVSLLIPQVKSPGSLSLT